MFLLSFIFILLLGGITVYSIWQNKHNYEVIREIEILESGISKTILAIRAAIEESSSMQALYLIRYDKDLEAKRKRIWLDEIHPSLNKLQRFTQSNLSKSLNNKVDQLKTNILKYEQHQEDIEQIISNITSDVKKEKENKLLKAQIIYASNLFSANNRYKSEIRHILWVLQEHTDKILKADIEDLQKRISLESTLIFISSLLTILITVAISILNYIKLKETIHQINSLLRKLVKGELGEYNEAVKNELAPIIEACNQLARNIKQASLFAKAVGKGQFEQEFNVLSRSDVLGNSLLKMRHRLREAAEKDKKNNWATLGQTQFSETIRKHNKDLDSLCNIFLSNLINYVEANQGGVFVRRDTKEKEIILDMKASYAYDRTKFLKKSIQVTQSSTDNLIGQVFLEKQKIIINKIPDNYSQIISGLGESKPRYLLIFPLIANERVEGVLELSSFKEIESYKIDFIEIVSENLSSNISAIRSKEQAELLLERLQTQTDDLKEKEFELKNNLDQLNDTQLETRKKQLELESLKSSLEIKVQERTQALEEALERFDLIIKSSSEGLWDMQHPLDQELDLNAPVNWSVNLKRIFGYGEKEFSDNLKGWLDKVHPEDKEKLVEVFRSAIKHGKEESVIKNQYRFLQANREYCWYEFGFRVRGHLNKNYLRLAGYQKNIDDSKKLKKVLRDLRTNQLALEESNKKFQSNSIILQKALSRARQKEKELREVSIKFSSQEAKLDNIIRNVSGIVFQLSYDTQYKKLSVLYVSDYISKIFGQEGDWLGNKSPEAKKIFDVLVLERKDQQALLKEFLISQKNLTALKWEGRVYLQKQKKDWKWLKINAFPRANKSGKRLLFEGIISDQSAEKKPEKELKNSSSVLHKHRST